MPFVLLLFSALFEFGGRVVFVGFVSFFLSPPRSP